MARKYVRTTHRYVTTTQILNDNTTKAAFTCIRTCNINTTGAGACLFQLTGGASGNANYNAASATGISCSWTVPSGVSSIVIEIWGGGGGGGAAPSGVCSERASGGGGGAYAKKSLAVTAGSSYTICVGSGGNGGTPTSASVCCCGLKGGTTYVTGTGLNNFCAEGGYGGESRCGSMYYNIISPNGGWPGSGGDINARGFDGGSVGGGNSDTYSGWTYGGGSPFGGRNSYMGHSCCNVQADNSSQNGVRGGGIIGIIGLFPGGGGTGGIASCLPASNCANGGQGAPGLVRIWM